MVKDSDKKFISYALNLARQNLGRTAPNPVVGCVIVKNKIIIASGVTAKNGRPHAEKIAIAKVKDKKILQDAEIYVTLEPCSHFGQENPCTEEIIKYKFKKVVIAAIDPDIRVNGKGIRKLREAGIKVSCKILQKEAQEINRGFFKARKHGLPFVTLKLATSLDSKIATKDFDSKWITTEKSRLFAHHLRSVNDAILIGAGTLIKDNPKLDCRIAGLEDFSPKIVIISNNLDFDSGLKVFQNGKTGPVTILTNSRDMKTKALQIKNLPVEIIFCAKKNNKVDLRDALKKLCINGINNLLIEGGQNLATQFLQENLVDELVWIRNKKIIGADGISAVGEMGFFKISDIADNFFKTEIKESGQDIIEIFRRNGEYQNEKYLQ
jgi:diaminohydroxyphosphoribosylaminopyrimidine deaminase/5-amino-6-(5-phosphoribosylamino)uracil reductase